MACFEVLNYVGSFFARSSRGSGIDDVHWHFAVQPAIGLDLPPDILGRRFFGVTSPHVTIGRIELDLAPTTNTVTYAFHSDRLPSSLNGSWITKSFDNVSRLTLTKLRKSGLMALNTHSYLYNQGHQRTRQTRTDASYATYTYDSHGQLKSGIGTGGESTENLGYTYDTAWNLNTRTNYGTSQAFVLNVKNELTSVDGLGCSYDSNGNLTYRAYEIYGPRSYTYVFDDENQLIEMRTDTTYTAPGSRWRPTWVYDGLGRARKRNDFAWSTGWYGAGEINYIYDGTRVIQERYYLIGGGPSVSYTRGNDLSGSLEGAGGIGGLLGRSHGYSGGNWTTHNPYHADGNGNVTYLVNSSQGLAASYRYDPYGRLMAQSGTLATANLYRFSSKELHAKSGMYYYGFRFYDPHLQRWLNRDPIGELGGDNLYAYINNDPVGGTDPFGLMKSGRPPSKPPPPNPLNPCRWFPSLCKPSGPWRPPTRPPPRDNYGSGDYGRNRRCCEASGGNYMTQAEAWGFSDVTACENAILSDALPWSLPPLVQGGIAAGSTVYPPSVNLGLGLGMMTQAGIASYICQKNVCVK